MDKQSLIIKLKLLLPKIPELNHDEWLAILFDNELKTLFLRRLKKNIMVDLSRAPEGIKKLVKKPDYFRYYLDILYNEGNTKEFLHYFYHLYSYDSEEREVLLDTNLRKKVSEYYEKNKNKILDLFIQNISDVDEKVSNFDMIQAIVDNNLPEYIGLISINPQAVLNYDIQHFIISNLDSIDAPIGVYSYKIESACLMKKKAYLLSNFYDRNEYLMEQILLNLDEGLDPEKIDIPCEVMINYKDSHIGAMRYLMIHGYGRFDNRTFDKYPSLIDDAIKLLESGKTLKLGNCERYPKLVAAKIKHQYDLDNNFNAIWIHDVKESLIHDHEGYVEQALIDATHDNKDIIYNIILNICLYSTDIDPFESILKKVLPKITFDGIVKRHLDYIGRTEVILEEIFSKYDEYINMSASEIPENFNLADQYPEKIVLAALPLIDIGKYNEFYEGYIENPEILEILLEKLAVTKNPTIMDTILYSKYLDIKLTPNAIKLILREDNPLNLSIENIKYLMGNNPKDAKDIDMLQLIKSRKGNMKRADFTCVYGEIFSMAFGNFEYYSIDSFDDHKFELLTELLSCNIEQPEEVCKALMRALVYFESYESSINSGRYTDKIREAIKSYMIRNKHIPLKLTINFDEETRREATYNLDDLSENPQIFDGDFKSPKDFHDWVIEAAKNNVPINLKILYKEVQLYPPLQNLLCNDNVRFDCAKSDENVVTLSTIILDRLIDEDIKKKCVTNYIKESLSYSYSFIIINFIVKHEDLLRLFMNRVKEEDFEKIDGSIVKCFSIEYSPEFKRAISSRVVEWIESGKISIPAKLLPELIDYNNEQLNEYLEKKYIGEFHINIYREIFLTNNIFYAIKKNSRLYGALIETLKNNAEYIEVIDGCIGEIPEIVQICVDYIKSIDNFTFDRTGKFHDIYFNKDVMRAILNTDSSNIHDYLYQIYQTDYYYTLVDFDIFEIMAEHIAKVYNFNLNGLIKLYKRYENEILLLIHNQDEKIFELLKCDEDIIDRFIEIFKVRKLDRVAIEAINDSFQQQIYAKENPDDINLFTNILRNVQLGLTDDFIRSVVEKLCKKDEKGNYLYIPEGLNIPDILLNHLYNTNKETFICVLLSKIKNDDEDVYKTILHIIIDNYIGEKRKEVTRNEDIYVDTAVSFKYDEKQLNDARIKYLLAEDKESIMEEIETCIGPMSKLEFDTFTYLTTPEKLNCDEERIKEIKKNIPVLKKKILTLPSISIELIDYDMPKKYTKGIKRILEIKERIVNIDELEEMNISSIIKVIKDDEKYTCLVRLIKKYKILDWLDTFAPAIEELSEESCLPSLITFVNSFNHIYDIEKEKATKKRDSVLEALEKRLMKKAGADNEELIKNIHDYIQYKKNEPIEVTISPYKIYRYASIFLAKANGYQIILGPEDSDIISRNEGPYSSMASDEARLEYCTKLMIDLIQTDEVTIPSFIKDHEFNVEGKRPLRVIVACKADPRNLSIGERTGACLRAFGHDHDLFTFSNSDSRGFNIIFEDPIDHTFISRVTGFRNGNTVCLNTLRYSVDSTKYSTEDVIEACKDIARELIERSKNSDMPIENVICDNSYALNDEECEKLSERNIGGEVFNGTKDISCFAVLLATSRKDGKPALVRPNADKQPKYKCCRLPLKRFEGPDIKFTTKVYFQRISAIRQTIKSGEEEYYKFLDYDFDIINNDFIYAILGQDFFVALDIYGNIIHDICVNKEEAIKEYHNAIAEVEEYKSMNMGGLDNGKQL